VKLDNELVRQILIEVGDQHGSALRLEIDGYTDEAVREHVGVLHNAGYVEAADAADAGPTDGESVQLTSKGQGLLAATRDERVWEKANRIVRGKAATFSADFRLGILMGILTGVANEIGCG
jgi:hypothetical protein